MTARKRTAAVAMSLLPLAVGLAVGGLMGHSLRPATDQGQLVAMIGETAAAKLQFHAEALSRLRLDEREQAINLLECLLDGEILAVWQKAQHPFSKLSAYEEKSLRLAKVYRSIYPSGDAQVQTALRDVPLRDLSSEECDSAICRLAEKGGVVGRP